MKKLIALLLALMMVLVCTAALAAGGDDKPTEPAKEDAGTSTTPAATTKPTAKDPSVSTGYNATTAPTTGLDASKSNTVKVSKKINATGTGAKAPVQDVTFTVGTGSVAGSSATAPAVTIAAAKFTTEGQEKADVEITLPIYSTVGVYTYPVTETDTNIAGMKYATDLELKVTVINGDSGLVIAGIALRQKTVKTDTIENDYVAHALTVTKTVSGNMGDKSKSFPITVVLKAPDNDKVYGSIGVTITGTGATVKDGQTNITTSIAADSKGWTEKTLKLSLKDNQSVKFDNLPDGVTYTVIEDSTITHIDGTPTDAQLADANAYVVSGEIQTAKALTADASVTITNTKNIDVDTGVALDFAPYMIIMALVLAGVALRIYRRREDN